MLTFLLCGILYLNIGYAYYFLMAHRASQRGRSRSSRSSSSSSSRRAAKQAAALKARADATARGERTVLNRRGGLSGGSGGTLGGTQRLEAQNPQALQQSQQGMTGFAEQTLKRKSTQQSGKAPPTISQQTVQAYNQKYAAEIQAGRRNQLSAVPEKAPLQQGYGAVYAPLKAAPPGARPQQPVPPQANYQDVKGNIYNVRYAQANYGPRNNERRLGRPNRPLDNIYNSATDYLASKEKEKASVKGYLGTLGTKFVVLPAIEVGTFISKADPRKAGLFAGARLREGEKNVVKSAGKYYSKQAEDPRFVKGGITTGVGAATVLIPGGVYLGTAYAGAVATTDVVNVGSKVSKGQQVTSGDVADLTGSAVLLGAGAYASARNIRSPKPVKQPVKTPKTKPQKPPTVKQLGVIGYADEIQGSYTLATPKATTQSVNIATQVQRGKSASTAVTKGTIQFREGPKIDVGGQFKPTTVFRAELQTYKYTPRGRQVGKPVKQTVTGSGFKVDNIFDVSSSAIKSQVKGRVDYGVSSGVTRKITQSGNKRLSAGISETAAKDQLTRQQSLIISDMPSSIPGGFSQGSQKVTTVKPRGTSAITEAAKRAAVEVTKTKLPKPVVPKVKPITPRTRTPVVARPTSSSVIENVTPREMVLPKPQGVEKEFSNTNFYQPPKQLQKQTESLRKSTQQIVNPTKVPPLAVLVPKIAERNRQANLSRLRGRTQLRSLTKQRAAQGVITPAPPVQIPKLKIGQATAQTSILFNPPVFPGRTPVGPPGFSSSTPWTPPFSLPGARGPVYDTTPSRVITGGKRTTGFIPSFTALALKITGPYKPGKLAKTGLDFRPITKNFRISRRRLKLGSII